MEYKCKSNNPFLGDIIITKEIKSFLEQFSVMVMSDGTRYYNIPYWFRIKDDYNENVIEILDSQDIISEIHRNKRIYYEEILNSIMDKNCKDEEENNSTES